MKNKYSIRNTIDLASPLIGTKVVKFSDQFFAPAKRILNPSPPVFKDNVFDKHGKWMDGWETRRRRGGGVNDFIIIKLGKPGKIKYVDINTAFFNGNQPEYAKIEGCLSKTSKLKSINWVKNLKFKIILQICQKMNKKMQDWILALQMNSYFLIK